MKKIVLIAIGLLCASACQTKTEKDQATTAASESFEPFEYAVLPDKDEWTITFIKPLEVVRQEIGSTEMPEPVWIAFPLPEFQERGRFQVMTPPGTRRSYGYGMDSGGCVPEALLKTNGIEYNHGWGISGGQYAYYQRVEVEDSLLYDPRQHAFLISYQGAHLEVSFPDLQTMRVRRLKAPDMTTVKHCGPYDDWRCRYENYCD